MLNQTRHYVRICLKINNIKAIFFDLGDIFFEAHYWRRWMYDRLSSNGNFIGSFTDYYKLWEKSLQQVYCGIKEYDTAFMELLDQMHVDDIDGFKKESYAMKSYYETSRKLFPGVKETLTKLHERGILNIVVTDNELEEEELREIILRRFHINDEVDGVVTSREVGVTKAEDKYFGYTLSKYSLDPHNVVFVGHDRDEIVSARKQNIRCILYNNYLEEHIDADEKIFQFSELLGLIE